MMSDPPSRLCLIPLTVFMTSFVAPLFPLTFPVVAAFAALPSPKRFDRKPPPPAPMAVKAWRLRGDGGSDEGSLRSTPMRGGSTCWNAAADRADDEEDNMVGKSCPDCCHRVSLRVSRALACWLLARFPVQAATRT